MADLRQSPTRPLDRIVRDIYGSLGEGLGFDRSLEAVGGALDSHITSLHGLDLAAGRGWLETTVGIGPSEFSGLAEAYATRWAGQNLWIERGLPTLLEKGYGTGEEVVSEKELVRTDYYLHFLKPVDVHFGLGINVFMEGRSRLTILTINRPKCSGCFTTRELQLVEQLRPHLVNAYAIHRRLTKLQDKAVSLRDAFDHAPIGILVLDRDGHVIEQNAEASRLLASNAGIASAADRGLRLACPATRARFRDALFRLSGECPAPLPECLVVGRPGTVGMGLLVLHLCVFPASASQLMARNGRILGFLCELNRHSDSEFSRRVLQSALNLTPMEAAVVVALREHNDPMLVVLHLGLAISTVRTHLKHVFRKTGTTRQSELLRLADRLLSVAPI